MKESLDGLKIIIPISVLGYGGTEIQTLSLVHTLVNLRCTIEVVCFYDYYDDVVRDFEESGVKVTLLKLKSRNNKIELFVNLYKLYRERNPDIVHIQYIEQGFVAIAAAVAAAVPVIIATVHQLGTSYGYRQHILLRIAARLSTSILCVSMATEKSWFNDSELWNPVKAKNRKHWTIYNCVDADRVYSLSSQINSQVLRSYYNVEAGQIIGVVGRISPEKGQSILLDALAIVVKSITDVKLLIVGDDRQQDDLMNKARLLGVDKNVIMTGRMRLDDVYKLYGIMDIVVVPSLFEGFGLSAAEAMAAKRPLIATRAGGLVEIVEDGVSGILVEPGNYESLAETILRCLKNPTMSERLGNEGQQRVKKMFSKDVYNNAIFTLYNWAIQSSR
jgi:L-malate glycosyltransferase